jgi:hypothetical protein
LSASQPPICRNLFAGSPAAVAVNPQVKRMCDVSQALRRALPPAVVDLARRCGAQTGDDHLDHVVLTQSGAMRADAAHRWAPFRARQSMAMDRVGFTWRAAAGPLGCVTITDALDEAGPRLTVVAVGLIPLAKVARDAALTKGELQRYLAELPLAPDAILRNVMLDWQALSPTCIRVSAAVRGVRAHVDLTLGADGLVASAFAPDRPHLDGAERPWRGCFSDYRTHQGRQIPFAAEAIWTLGGRDVAYWRGEILTWALSAVG